MTETVVSSFILRFTQETDADAPWRGVVRHVQSDEEARFTRIDEALRFIGRYVDLDRAGAVSPGQESTVGSPPEGRLSTSAISRKGQ